MDEDVTEESTIKPVRHDRWSVLILAVNCAANVAQVVTNTLEGYTLMVAQHANQKIYDKKFEGIAKGYDG